MKPKECPIPRHSSKDLSQSASSIFLPASIKPYSSILAKVARDRYIVELDSVYPEYNFKKHKGYGTALHIEMLKKYGASEVHRKTFIKKFV